MTNIRYGLNVTSVVWLPLVPYCPHQNTQNVWSDSDGPIWFFERQECEVRRGWCRSWSGFQRCPCSFYSHSSAFLLWDSSAWKDAGAHSTWMVYFCFFCPERIMLPCPAILLLPTIHSSPKTKIDESSHNRNCLFDYGEHWAVDLLRVLHLDFF